MVIIAGSVGVARRRRHVNINQISTFSNRAGTGAQYYLTALGYRDRAPDQTGTQFLWSGTSFSAPTITGAVALLAQAFPNLTGAQIVDILFQSADDLGAAGIDAIYGHGRLNIARAFQPIGTTSLAGQPDGGQHCSQRRPAGARRRRRLERESLGAIILDGYDRAFVLNLAADAAPGASTTSPLARALQQRRRVGGAAGRPGQHRDDGRASGTTCRRALRSSGSGSAPRMRARRG